MTTDNIYLYKDAREYYVRNDGIPNKKGNQGLRFNRFAYLGKDAGAKLSFLKNFSGPCGDEKALAQQHQQQVQLANACQGDTKVFTLAGHFVTGMGNPHPVENGFLWHYTLGVPYLSGSMVKGMLRSFITHYYQASNKDTLLTDWFGGDSAEHDGGKSGKLIFFDALPIKTPILSVDIMTPHMNKWYSKGASVTDNDDISDIYPQIPADWHEPTPIPFLAVKDAQFAYSIGKRFNGKKDTTIDINEVFFYLEKALEWLGAGAKTQTGYGYMTLDSKKTAKVKEILNQVDVQAQEAQQQADEDANAKSELHLSLLQSIRTKKWNEKTSESDGTFFAEVASWLDALEKTEEEGIKECVMDFYQIMQVHIMNAKKPEKIKKPNHKKYMDRINKLCTKYSIPS